MPDIIQMIDHQKSNAISFEGPQEVNLHYEGRDQYETELTGFLGTINAAANGNSIPWPCGNLCQKVVELLYTPAGDCVLTVTLYGSSDGVNFGVRKKAEGTNETIVLTTTGTTQQRVRIPISSQDKYLRLNLAPATSGIVVNRILTWGRAGA